MSQASELPRVTILLASYNGRAYIRDQLSTILSQSSVAVKIVVRDDGSTDGTVDVVLAHPNVQLFEPGGQPTRSAAANFARMLVGVDLSDADYVALADQDDLWLPEKLSRGVQALRRSGASGYSSNLIAFDNDGARLPWLIAKHGVCKSFDHLFQGASAGCTYVLTRECVERIRPKIEAALRVEETGWSHDWLIYALVRNQRLRWFFDDYSSLLYRQHARNVYGSRPGLRGIIGRVKLLRERWYRRQILWVARQLELDEPERRIVERVGRMGLVDRLWLAVRAGQFRRRPRDIIMLRLALLFGMV